MSGLVIPDHLTHLHVRRSMPVPWVAVWSFESDARSARIDFGVTPQGLVGRSGTRDRYGMTFIDAGDRWRGHGVPDFGATSSGRQQRSMLKPRCQVCGTVIAGVPWWLVPDEDGWVDRDAHTTKQPPVCAACADTVDRWCPHLRRFPYTLAQAVGVPVAVFGDAHLRNGTVAPAVVVDLDDPLRRWVLGRELIVRLDPAS